MASRIPPMLKYSIVHNFLNSPPILIEFVSKFIVCLVLYALLVLEVSLKNCCSPLTIVIMLLKKCNLQLKIVAVFGNKVLNIRSSRFAVLSMLALQSKGR